MMVQGGEVVSYERGIPVGFGVCLGLEGEADILDGIAAPRNAEHPLLFQPSLVQGFQAPVVFVCVCVRVCVCVCVCVRERGKARARESKKRKNECVLQGYLAHKTNPFLGPYSRLMHRALWWS